MKKRRGANGYERESMSCPIMQPVSTYHQHYFLWKLPTKGMRFYAHGSLSQDKHRILPVSPGLKLASTGFENFGTFEGIF